MIQKKSKNSKGNSTIPPSTTPNFLIGYGERLTGDVERAGRIITEKAPPYTVSESIDRLQPELLTTAKALAALPPQACPGGETVALLTLHPEFLAKSYYPATIMGEAGLRPIGSRSRLIRPKKWSPRAKPETRDQASTIEIYVAGRRDKIIRWAKDFQTWTSGHRGADDLIRIEELRTLNSLTRRLQPIENQGDQLLLEVALHDDISGIDIVSDFNDYIETLGGSIERDLVVSVRGLSFLPVRLPRKNYPALGQYSFLRVARPLSKLRGIAGAGLRTASSSGVYLPPSQAAVNPTERVAILDGGLPDDHRLPATNLQEIDVGLPDRWHRNHGLMVTGAYLHGPLEDGVAARRPYTSVEHYRVLDVDDDRNDVQQFKVLHRIQDIVTGSGLDLFNISLGPDISVEDDEVHVWTSTLDQLASSGKSLLMVAAGNNGDLGAPLSRIQVPGDGVNICCIGASDRRGPGWNRAPYSAIGPGRRPGIVKPDLVAFGGSDEEDFFVLRPQGSGYGLVHKFGTSIATPLAMRAAGCLRAHYGSQLKPLTLRALLIHTAEQDGSHAPGEVGWGRVGAEENLLICPDSTARVIYQGELTPKRSLRAKIPLPTGLTGNVTITATICFASSVSAADPMNYTNHGLEIAFRPNAIDFERNKNTKKLSKHAKTAPFFGERYSDYASEEERRVSQYKWETVIHGSKTKRVSGLVDPVFDVHLVPRDGVRNTNIVDPVPYAMVISLHSTNNSDIYNKVLQTYSSRLQALAPVRIPIRTTT